MQKFSIERSIFLDKREFGIKNNNPIGPYRIVTNSSNVNEWRTQKDSNPHNRFRRPMLYPLNYGCGFAIKAILYYSIIHICDGVVK